MPQRRRWASGLALRSLRPIPKARGSMPATVARAVMAMGRNGGGRLDHGFLAEKPRLRKR